MKPGSWDGRDRGIQAQLGPEWGAGDGAASPRPAGRRFSRPSRIRSGPQRGWGAEEHKNSRHLSPEEKAETGPKPGSERRGAGGRPGRGPRARPGCHGLNPARCSLPAGSAALSCAPTCSPAQPTSMTPLFPWQPRESEGERVHCTGRRVPSQKRPHRAGPERSGGGGCRGGGWSFPTRAARSQRARPRPCLPSAPHPPLPCTTRRPQGGQTGRGQKRGRGCLLFPASNSGCWSWIHGARRGCWESKGDFASVLFFTNGSFPMLPQSSSESLRAPREHESV